MSEPNLVIHNKTDTRRECIIGCKQADDVVFAEERIINSGEILKFNNIPNEEFEVAVSLDGRENGKYYSSAKRLNEIHVYIRENKILFDEFSYNNKNEGNNSNVNHVESNSRSRTNNPDYSQQRQSHRQNQQGQSHRQNQQGQSQSIKRQPAADERYCHSCREIIKETAEICSNCGVNVVSSESKNSSENQSRSKQAQQKQNPPKTGIRRMMPAFGSLLALVSLTQNYAVISGSVIDREVFQDIPVSLTNLMDILSGGFTSIDQIIYIPLSVVLFATGFLTLVGVVVSFKNRFIGGYLLLSTWVSFWVIVVGAVNTVSVPGVSQLTVQYEPGFYLLMIGSAVVFGDYMIDELINSKRYVYISIAGSILAYISLFFPYFKINGMLFNKIEVDMGLTLVGLGFTVPGSNTIGVIIMAGLILAGGFLAMKPGLMFPKDWSMKSQIYPEFGAVAIGIGFIPIFLIKRAVESLGVTVSFGLGFYIAVLSLITLIAAKIYQTREVDLASSYTS